MGGDLNFRKKAKEARTHEAKEEIRKLIREAENGE